MKNIIKIYLSVAAAVCCLLVFGNHSKAFEQSDIAASPQITHSVYRPQAKLTASDGGQNNAFGSSVAISGETAVVGAYYRDEAYVYVRSGTNWTQQAILRGSDTLGGDFFGESVSISGDRIIVGAGSAKIGTNTEQGAAYIFTRSGTTWTQQAKLTAADGAADDYFGSSVAISGASAIVGAFGDDIGANQGQGSAYTFALSGTIWSEEQKLFDAGGAAGNGYGVSVALSNTTAIVASYRRLASFIYLRSGNNWNLQQTLPDPYFARTVAINGDTAVVADPSRNGQGITYVFVRSGTMWTLQQTINSPPNANSFGSSVSISGDRMVIGATSNYFAGPNFGQNSAYIFVRSGTTWNLQSRFTADPIRTGDAFGSGVGVNSTGTVIVGAGLDTIGGNSNQGSASIFVPVNVFTPFDFDGDGKSDVSVFRPSNGSWYIQQSQNGFTGVAFGAATDLPAPADFDGDGKSDVAVFRPSNGGWYYLRSSDNAFVGVTFGQNGDLPRPADYDGDGKADINVFRPSTGSWYRLNSSNGAFFGVAFGQNGDKPLIADFDGDGKSDIAVFRPFSSGYFYSLDSSTGNFRGVAFGFGTDLPTPADFDGDGKTDIAIFRPDNGGWYRLNSTTGAFSGVAFGQFGDIPVPADYDGDGKADVAVFRNGIWYYLNSSNGAFTGLGFGAGTDKPIPSAFIQ